MNGNRSRKQWSRLGVIAVLGLSMALLLIGTASGAAGIMRASTDSAGIQGDLDSTFSSISGDGRYVAFESNAANFTYDNNNTSDIFLKDTQTGQTTMVSTDSTGYPGNGASSRPSISLDGRYVAFQSYAGNLVAGDTNAIGDVFVKDVQTGQITRVSTNSAGNQVNMYYDSHSASISADGRYVAFMTIGDVAQGQGYTNGSTDVFVKDRQTGQTTLISSSSTGAMANHYSWDCAISGDGRYVTFSSTASNLVAGDTNSVRDVFVKDRQTGQTSRVSTNSTGIQGNGATGWIGGYTTADVAISGDGRYVAFHSNASNMVYGDTNSAYDIFVKDTQTGTTVRASTSTGGGQANNASNQETSISADGRYVTFSSDATNLVSGDTNSLKDIFIKDLQTGQTARLSTDSSGGQSGPGWEECFGDPYEDLPEDIYCIMHGGSFAPAISTDGSSVSFYTEATNLVPGDTNGVLDVMLADNSLIGCTAARPSLTLSKTSTYWGSYAAYTARLLSVNWTISNTGSNGATNVAITGSTNTNGVTISTLLPASVGNISAGSSAMKTLVYNVPLTTGGWWTSTTASAGDDCGGTGYTYP